MASSTTAQMQWFASTGKTNWSTPQRELARVRRVDALVRGLDQGRIGFDPCSNPFAEPLVAASSSCMLERGENGLSRDWRGRGLVFWNPPYGKGEVEQFTAKNARDFGGERRLLLGVDQSIGLVPANTETRWYHRDIVKQADATCLREGRIGFIDPANGEEVDESTVKNLYVYSGDHADVFLKVFEEVGDARLTKTGARRLIARGYSATLLDILSK